MAAVASVPRAQQTLLSFTTLPDLKGACRTNMYTTTHWLRLSSFLILLTITLTASANAQEQAQPDPRLISFTSEFIGRYWATKQVLPVYPAEAIARGRWGVVEVGIGITDEGRVAKVRVPPGLDPALAKAAVAAAKQWMFRPFVNKMGADAICFFRLTFNFVIEAGRARTELYNPPYETPQHRRMRGARYRDLTEWLKWEDASADN